MAGSLKVDISIRTPAHYTDYFSFIGEFMSEAESSFNLRVQRLEYVESSGSYQVQFVNGSGKVPDGAKESLGEWLRGKDIVQSSTVALL